MQIPTQLIAELVGARLVGGLGPSVVMNGATVDSRNLRPGELFIALRGQRDGHEFVESAISAGAAAFLGEQEVGTSPGVVVPDSSAALLGLAKAARAGLGGVVIGVTGSVGKTSTKDFLAASLGSLGVTSASQKSFNNEIGVPLTLLNAPDNSEYLVVEMGARAMGHIEALCEIALPTIGVITAVEAVHTELFGDLAAVARAKSELVRSLPASGTAFLNADDPNVIAMAELAACEVISVGTTPKATLQIAIVDVNADLRARVRFSSPWGSGEARLGLRGSHQIVNAGLAAAVALQRGAKVEAVCSALSEARGSAMRMDLMVTASGVTLVNDSYNASPVSMRAAIASLLAIPSSRRIAVLGLMAELGPQERRLHQSIADLCASKGIELVAVDTDLYGVTSVSVLEAADMVKSLPSGVAVLVKGSRVAGLERVVSELS